MTTRLNPKPVSPPTPMRTWELSPSSSAGKSLMRTAWTTRTSSGLEANDQARIDPETDLELIAYRDCSFVLIDVPSCKGWGYDEKPLKGAKA